MAAVKGEGEAVEHATAVVEDQRRLTVQQFGGALTAAAKLRRSSAQAFPKRDGSSTPADEVDEYPRGLGGSGAGGEQDPVIRIGEVVGLAEARVVVVCRRADLAGAGICAR